MGATSMLILAMPMLILMNQYANVCNTDDNFGVDTSDHDIDNDIGGHVSVSEGSDDNVLIFVVLMMLMILIQ